MSGLFSGLNTRLESLTETSTIYTEGKWTVTQESDITLHALAIAVLADEIADNAILGGPESKTDMLFASLRLQETKLRRARQKKTNETRLRVAE